MALTGYGRPEDRDRAVAAGFETRLVKPVDLERLARVLDGRTADEARSPTRGLSARVPRHPRNPASVPAPDDDHTTVR